MKRITFQAIVVAVSMIAGGLLAGPVSEAAQDFSDVTINIVTQSGMIGEPVERWAKTFKDMTGATINVTKVRFDRLHDTIQKGFPDQTYDVTFYCSVWTADFAGAGYFEDLTDRIQADTDLQWNDVAPFFQKIPVYGKRLYGIPVDGDYHLLYYRSDVLKQAGLTPPKTWEEYLSVAKAVHGQDMNGDGEPDFGSCFPKKEKGESYWFFTTFLAPFIQAKGTNQGVFFDQETMKPLVNNEAFERALEIYAATMKYGVVNDVELDTGETIDLFVDGRCALSLFWGDVGTAAVRENSKVKETFGAAILPGSKKVLDHKTGKLVDCDEERCPYAVDGINYAPFAAFGGWTGAINAGSNDKTKEAAYAFLSFLSQPAQSQLDVTQDGTGFNPYRYSHFQDIVPWLNAGMNENAAKLFLGGIGDSMKHDNLVLDLFIPHSVKYQGEVLDSVLHKFLIGEISKKEAMRAVEKGWEAITDEAGREQQRKAYMNSLVRFLP